MQKPFLILFLMLMDVLTYGDISQIPVYPSGIKVSFTAPPVEKKEEIKEMPTSKRFSRRRKKKAKEEILPMPSVPAEPVKVTRLIRVINSIRNTDENHQAALVFYNEDRKLLKNSTVIIENSVKPSASYIFFMDRSSGNNFKGMKDIYHLPEQAAFFQAAVVDKKGNILIIPSHPGYDQAQMIAIADYNKIMPRNKIMLQFELTGTEEKPHIKIAAFRFH